MRLAREGLLVAVLTSVGNAVPAEAPVEPQQEDVADEAGGPGVVRVQAPCRCLTTVVDSPAAVTVIPAEAIASAPDRRFGELLRQVPGVNAVQTSNREHNLTSRQATSTLANSTLVLIDGRSLYQDFVGVILWDMIPIDPVDVEQIEVVRGPASAVWGANAFTGVVNILTRPPREAEGASVLVGLTSFDREAGSTVGEGAGLGYYGSTTLSRAPGPGLAYRISGGYSASDPLARPVGTLPVIPHPLQPETEVGGGRLPADESGSLGDFRNRGTTQPWVDLRFDQTLGSGHLVYSAGVAGSDGIVHTGIGPFALERGARTTYARATLERGGFRAAAHYNYLGARAPNLLALDEDSRPVRLDVTTHSFDVDVGYSRATRRDLLTFGGNLRRNVFDISLAAAAPDRTELGAFVQEELFFGWGAPGRRRELRVLAGARLDRFGNIAGVVFSPRLSVMWKPSPEHSVRFSVNRAFRAPTVINNYLDQVILRPVELAPLFPDLPPELEPEVEDPFPLPQRALGTVDLQEESLTSFEIGYIGTLEGRTTLGVNLYINDTRDNINLTRLPDGFDPWTEEAPPPDWPLPPGYIDDLAARGIYLPRTAQQFLNLGPIRHKGVELFVEHRFEDRLKGFLNYSWQPEPRPLPDESPFPALEITLPPRNRVNAGLYWSGRRYVGSLGLNHADRAFWTDVLPHDFDGYSEAYTMFNAAFGLRWADGRILTMIRGTNLTNALVQEHNYGDLIRRRIALEVRLAF